MEHPGFFERAGPFRLDQLARELDASFGPDTDPGLMIEDVLTLADADARHISFMDNRKYLDALAATKAGACLVAPGLAARVPVTTRALVTKAPYRGFAKVLHLFYPQSMRSLTAGVDARSVPGGIHASARIEEGVIIEPGAVVGREAHIGRGSTIAAGALVGYRVTVGRDCYIGPSASLTHALIGNGVIIHAGVRIGQDGFGFAMGPAGHLKVPQIGRVIVQDNVEIGANSAVDRGALKDTIIGEGTKIDNLVQIGHNVVIGRHCVIVGQAGIAGSTTLGDFVIVGGQAAIVGHLKIGSGAQIAGASGVTGDVAAGARMAGIPARPIKEFAREVAMIRRLGQKRPSDSIGDTGDEI